MFNSWKGFPSGIIRQSWNDTEKISMAPAQGWHAQIEKCKQWCSTPENFPCQSYKVVKGPALSTHCGPATTETASPSIGSFLVKPCWQVLRALQSTAVTGDCHEPPHWQRRNKRADCVRKNNRDIHLPVHMGIIVHAHIISHSHTISHARTIAPSHTSSHSHTHNRVHTHTCIIIHMFMFITRTHTHTSPQIRTHTHAHTHTRTQMVRAKHLMKHHVTPHRRREQLSRPTKLITHQRTPLRYVSCLRFPWGGFPFQMESFGIPV
jgi:hypothetical protein